LDESAYSKEFLNEETTVKRREEIVENFLKLDVEKITSRWKEYFDIDNKDREKFWEKLNELQSKSKFINTARHLTNTQKIDVYNKTPLKYQDVFVKEVIPDISTTKSAKKPLITVIAIYLIAFMIVNLVFLLPIVTVDIPKEEILVINNMTSQIALVPSDGTVTYNFGLLDGKTFDIDTHFIFLVVLAGSLGALIHGLAKISQNTQEGSVRNRDTLWYVGRPFLGAALAIAVYMTLRGGLLTTSNIEILNPYGVTALSIIVGLSTKQVTQKLKDLLDSVFPTKNPDEDNSKEK